MPVAPRMSRKATNPSPAFDALQNMCDGLLRNAARRVRRERPRALQALEGRFRVGEFLLAEAQEFAVSAWEELKAGRSRASLATSRWLLEAALNLLWVTAPQGDLEDRLRFLVAEALRQEGALLDGLVELNAVQAKQFGFEERAVEARQRGKELMEQVVERYRRSLDARIKSIMPLLQAKGCSKNPYALYRICCGAAHPGLDIRRRFQLCPGGATVTRGRPDLTSIACFVLAASTWWLIGGVYQLALPNKPKLLAELTDWWANKVSPLIDVGFKPR